MNYRLATIHPESTHAADVTVRIDIDVQDPISQLVVMHEITQGAYAVPDGHPAECISKIELIDGSEVLYSLSGVQAQAADFYHNEKEPYAWVRWLNGNDCSMMFLMNFGRFLYDPQLAFDPMKFRNPRLEITIDVNGGGRNVTTGDLTVFAHLFDQKAISPVGFLMHKEIKNYNLANGSHEYTNLPTDYPYRKLFIRAQRNNYHFDQQIANIKLAEDVDKRVIINHSGEELIDVLTSRVKPYIEHIIGDGTSILRYFHCTPCHNVVIAGVGWVELANTGLSFFHGEGGYFSTMQTTANRNFQAIIHGQLPHAVLEIPFGDQKDIDDWYDVTTVGKLSLDITAGAAVNTQPCSVFLQQLKRY